MNELCRASRLSRIANPMKIRFPLINILIYYRVLFSLNKDLMMTIKYSIIENPLRKGMYSPKVIHDSTLNIETLARNIVSKTTLTEGTVQAVISALREEIIGALLQSNNVNIDNLVTISTSLRGLFENINTRINQNNAQLYVNTRISSTINNNVRREAHYIRVTSIEKSPAINLVQSTVQYLNNYYMPNAPLRIIGNNLKFNAENQDEGIVCIKSDGSTHHIPYYSVISNKRIDLTIAENLGDIHLQVKVRYSNLAKIQTKTYKALVKIMIATAFEDIVIIRSYVGASGTTILTVEKESGNLSYQANGDTAGMMTPIPEAGTYTLLSGTMSNSIIIDILDYEAYRDTIADISTTTVEIML